MATSLVFPPPGNDVGWFEGEAAGKLNLASGSASELFTSPTGAPLTSDDRQTLLVWAVFRRQFGADDGSGAEEISAKLDTIQETLDAYLDGLTPPEVP